MNVQVVHAPVHTYEQARAIMIEALKLADECGAKVVTEDALFNACVQLLAARASVPLVEQSPPMLLPRMDVPRGRG